MGTGTPRISSGDLSLGCSRGADTETDPGFCHQGDRTQYHKGSMFKYSNIPVGKLQPPVAFDCSLVCDEGVDPLAFILMDAGLGCREALAHVSARF